MVKIDELVMPFGKGFAAVSVRKLVDDMAKKYTAVIEPEIKVMAFKNKDDYFIYSRIPSKTNDKYQEKIYYDIVLQLSAPNGNMKAKDTNIRHWDVKVFNNNPSFMFTFDYAFYSRRALINLPNGYYGKLAIKQKPKVRNPLMLLGIDEDIWFTILYMDKNHWFDRDIIDVICNTNPESLNFKWLVDQIIPQEQKLKEVQDRSLRARNQEKQEKAIEKLTKNEKEREKQERKQNTRLEGHALSGNGLMRSQALRNSNFSDLSTNLRSGNSSQLAMKSTLRDRSKLGKTKLKSSL